jgi:hypothetical protein
LKDHINLILALVLPSGCSPPYAGQYIEVFGAWSPPAGETETPLIKQLLDASFVEHNQIDYA